MTSIEKKQQVGTTANDTAQIIETARILMRENPASKASEKSATCYRREFDRLVKRGPDILKSAIDTTKSSTWYLRRAAILHIVSTTLRERLLRLEEIELAEGISQTDSWHRCAMDIRISTNLYQRTRDHSPLTVKTPRQTKRRIWVGLPCDWREQLLPRLPQWRNAYLIAAVSGCRPCELQKGVQIDIEGDEMIVKIRGAKLSQRSGQEWRRLVWKLPIGSPLVRQLAAQVNASGGHLFVNLGSNNTNPPRAFSDAIRQAAKRAWGERKQTITAYSLRHAAASDLKSSGLNSSDISAALGHFVTSTKSTYGHATSAKGVSVAPQKVTAAREVQVQLPTFPQSQSPVSRMRQRE